MFVSVSTDNTARPSNLNYSDLSRTEWRTINPSPLNVHTDASFEIAQCNIAAQVRRALDVLVLGTLPFSYNRVLDQDRVRASSRARGEADPDLFVRECRNSNRCSKASQTSSQNDVRP